LLVTIAIPCYNSAKLIESVVGEILDIFAETSKYEPEIVLVNDGSQDNTFEVIYSLCGKYSSITGVSLSKNFGQAAAKMAALDYTHGDILIYMDDDGQHPADGIIALSDKIQEGYDVVYASFPEKQHSVFTRLTSSLHGKFMNIIGAKNKEFAISSFQAFSQFAINEMKSGGELVNKNGRYIRMLTNNVSNVPLQHRKRLAGQSGYTFKKRLKKWVNSATSLNAASLKLATNMGILFGISGFVGAIYMVIRKLLHPWMQAGFASTLVSILFVGGVVMFCIGILGEYIGKMYLILCQVPLYKVRTVIGKINECRLDEETKGD
jgi:undecaprenyl-phosphate 4-deoxy-4-formamido-L-arabinose transferase